MPRKQTEIAVADFETNPFAPGVLVYEPFCVGFAIRNLVEVFWGTAKACVEWLIKKSKQYGRIIIYLHNGGNFDIHLMLEYLPVAACEFFTIGKRIVQLKLPWGAELRDSFAIIPKPLRSTAAGKKEISYWKFKPEHRERYKLEILAYLRVDLSSLLATVRGYIERFPLSLTLASSIFKLMKTDFGIDPPRMPEKFDAIFRPFFFGGRVQFFQLGRCEGTHHLVDVNSMYPAAMTNKHWFGGCKQVTGKLPTRNFEQCLFEIDGLSLGVFPVRQKDGSIDFPCTEGRFQCTGWELAYGLESGRVVVDKVRYCFEPAQTLDFGNFVQHFYEGKNAAKKAGDTAEEFFFKIALNSGYGKYALQPKRFKEVVVTEYGEAPPEIIGVEWALEWDDESRGLSFWSRSSYREGIDQYVNVATAASITGCARAMLLRAMDQCDGVKYVDTDSICAENIDKLQLSDRLGEWKHELTFLGSRAYLSEAYPGNSFYIAGKKLYAGYGRDRKGKGKWKTASKGVQLKPRQIISVALGHQVTAVSKAPTFSVFSERHFVRRRITRADKR